MPGYYSRGGIPFGLPTKDRSYAANTLKAGVPILDQDFNLANRVQLERIQNLHKAMMTDGWFSMGAFTETGEPNSLIMGDSEIILDGMIIDVKGFFSDDNAIPFESAWDSQDRYDLVWLEFWYELLDRNSTMYKYGNVDYYGTNFTNDIVDPQIGFEAYNRIQARYRIRRTVGGWSMLSHNKVEAQGSASTPISDTDFTYDSARKHYYCDVGTDYSVIDGYVYALPICRVFRPQGNDMITLGNVTDLREQIGARSGLVGMVEVEATITSWIWSSTYQLYYADVDISLVGQKYVQAQFYDTSDDKRFDPYDVECIDTSTLRVWMPVNTVTARILVSGQ